MTPHKSNTVRSNVAKPNPIRIDLVPDAIYFTARVPLAEHPTISADELSDIVINTPGGPQYFSVKPKIRDGWVTFVVPGTVEEGRELLQAISSTASN